MRYTNPIFLFACTLFFFIGCQTSSSESDSDGSIHNEDVPLLKEISSYIDEKEILITYYISDVSDWMYVKDELILKRNDLLEKYPTTKSLALVCYTEPSKTPIVSSNPNFAWNHEFDAYRACSIDNNHGFWRYCYGGIHDVEGKKGDWKHILPLE